MQYGRLDPYGRFDLCIDIHQAENGWVVQHMKRGDVPPATVVFNYADDLAEYVRRWAVQQGTPDADKPLLDPVPPREGGAFDVKRHNPSREES